MRQLPAIVGKSAFAFTTHIDGAFHILIKFGKTCNSIANLLYDGYIIVGCCAQTGSLFVLLISFLVE